MTNPNTVEQRIANLEDAMGKLIDLIGEQGKILENMKGAEPKKKGLFGGKTARVAIKDTKTGITYPSQANLTKSLGTEFGVNPLDHFGCFKIYQAAPGRFVRLEGADAENAFKSYDEKVKAEVEAANARLAAQNAQNPTAAPAAPAAAPSNTPSQEDAALQAAKEKLTANKKK